MLNEWGIRYGADVMRSGGIIAYPTEAVWGLGCDPWNQESVERLLRLKNRPVEKGLILIASLEGQIAELLKHLNAEQLERVRSSWPGPNTWLLPDPESRIPAWVKGQFSSVAVRVTDHPVAKGLCERFGGPIISTSANPGGSEPALTKSEVSGYFHGGVDYYVQGKLGGNPKPSTIRDVETGTLVRQ